MKKKLKTFTLDLRRMARDSWYCGSRACTMGQFAEQYCNINDWKPKYYWEYKGNEALNRCNTILGSEICTKIINVNDSHESWDKKLIKIRKLFNKAGYRVVVKR